MKFLLGAKSKLPGYWSIICASLSLILILVMALGFVADWTPSPLKVSVHQDDLRTLYVSFTNTNDKFEESVKVLRNVDGALYSWCMPYYDLKIIDQNGHEIELPTRCGNFGHPWLGTVWPTDYVMDIQPGETRTVTIPLTHEIPADGIYTVTFEYIYEPDKAEHKFAYPYPEDL